MSNKKIGLAISAVLALGISCSANAADKDPAPTMQMNGSLPGMEKCYGVAKAGMNDCGTAQHNCGGEAKVNGAKNEWVNMPTGLCNKIVGGNLKSS
jgi:uncharacterized membrane protein